MSFEALEIGFEALELSFEVSYNNFEVGHGETLDWGGWWATLDPVGVAMDRHHSGSGDRRQSNLEICWSWVYGKWSWSANLQQTIVQFGGIFGWLLGSLTMKFGPAIVNLLMEKFIFELENWLRKEKKKINFLPGFNIGGCNLVHSRFIFNELITRAMREIFRVIL